MLYLSRKWFRQLMRRSPLIHEKIVKLKRFFFLQNKGKSQEQGHSQTCYTCLETWSFTKKTFLSIFLHCGPVLLSRGFASAFFSSFLRIVDSVDCVMPNLSPTSLVYFSSPNAVRISAFSSRVSWHCLFEATSLFSQTDDIFFLADKILSPSKRHSSIL